MSRAAIAADTDESPDKPSVKTLQMIWKEGADWKSVELLKRPNAGVILNTSIPSVNGLQAYVSVHGPKADVHYAKTSDSCTIFRHECQNSPQELCPNAVT